MNSTPKGAAGIALLLLAAARTASRENRRPEAPVRRWIPLRATVGRIAAAYPSATAGWGRAA
jgi:hypothetical protein